MCLEFLVKKIIFGDKFCTVALRFGAALFHQERISLVEIQI